ncbi:hypothetical protein ACP275_10G064300 [Erythranthe tilingii]
MPRVRSSSPGALTELLHTLYSLLSLPPILLVHYTYYIYSSPQHSSLHYLSKQYIPFSSYFQYIMVKSPDQPPPPPSSAAAAALTREAAASSSSCKYKGVRKRKWGKYVSEIRLPNCRDRIWLGSYDTAEKAARAFDAALFCLRGKNAKFNFPENPPQIPDGRSMTPAEIQVAAARFANLGGGGDDHPHATGTSGRVEDLDLDSHSDSPCASVLQSEVTEIPLDGQFLDMGTDNYMPEFGSFPGFDDYSGDYMAAPPLPNADYWSENQNIEEFSYSEGSFLWNF